MQLEGKFKAGLRIANALYTRFVVKEIDTGELLDVEEEVSSAQPIAFSAHLATRQLVEVSNEKGEIFTGPFTIGMIRSMKPMDFKLLRAKMAELETLGEAVLPEENPG